MQLDKMTEKHYQYLQRQFGLDRETFDSICEEDGDKLDELIEQLMWKECDASEEREKTGEYSEDGRCSFELIDIICGPYNSDDVNDDNGADGKSPKDLKS